MRRFAVLLVGGAMAALILATVGIAWAASPGPPRVVDITPADDATEIDRDASITARFSERMMRSTITVQTVYLEKAGVTPILAEVKYNKRKKKAILNPVSSLEAHTQYTVTVEGAGDGDELAVKDRAGKSMASDFTWTFTTGA